MPEKISRARMAVSAVFLVVVLILCAVWGERHRWSWPATWISGLATSVLGMTERMIGTLNTNAAGFGVLLTLAFGLLSWCEKRKQTRAIMEAAANGTLHVEADD